MKNHGDFLPADGDHFPFVFGRDIFVLEKNVSGNDSARAGNEAQQSQTRYGFTAAGFTHQSQRLTGLQAEVDPVYCLYNPGRCVKVDPESLNIKQKVVSCHGCGPIPLFFESWIKRVR